MNTPGFPRVTVGPLNIRVILQEGGEEIVFSRKNYESPGHGNLFTLVSIMEDEIGFDDKTSIPKSHVAYAKLLSECKSRWLSSSANVTRLSDEFLDDEWFPFTFVQLLSNQCPHEEFANCFAHKDITQWKQTIANSHAIINTRLLPDSFPETIHNLILRDRGVLLVLRCHHRIFNEKFLYNTVELNLLLSKERKEALRSHPMGTGLSVGTPGSNGTSLIFVIPEVSVTNDNGEIDEDSVARIIDNEVELRRRHKLKYRFKTLVRDFNLYAKNVTKKITSHASDKAALRVYVDSEFEHVNNIEQILNGRSSQTLLDKLAESRGEISTKRAMIEAVKALSASVEKMNDHVESILDEEQDIDDFDPDDFDDDVEIPPKQEPENSEFSLFGAIADWSRESQERDRTARAESDRRDQENASLQKQNERDQRRRDEAVLRAQEDRRQEESRTRDKDRREKAAYDQRERELEIVYTLKGGSTQIVSAPSSPSGAHTFAKTRLRKNSNTIGYVIRNKNGKAVGSG